MDIPFYKYQGTGNDFIIIDNRSVFFDKKNKQLIALMCDRKFGIGADGLILLENASKYDFKMIYFNADGHEGTMCGNGGRCIVSLANKLKIIQDNTLFEAVDGLHKASFVRNQVKLQMKDVNFILEDKKSLFLDTGSPHYITFKKDIDALDVNAEGRNIRYNKKYKKEGVNVNFVEQIAHDIFKVRTYERGVEKETLSCGSGVTAVAIAADHLGKTEEKTIFLHTKGGMLEVSFIKEDYSYVNVFLKADATFVFQGVFKA